MCCRLFYPTPCRYLLISKKSLIGMELISFDVDGQECDSLLMCFPRPVTIKPEECPHDYLRIYDGRDESSPIIATLCGRYVRVVQEVTTRLWCTDCTHFWCLLSFSSRSSISLAHRYCSLILVPSLFSSHSPSLFYCTLQRPTPLQSNRIRACDACWICNFTSRSSHQHWLPAQGREHFRVWRFSDHWG